MLRLFILGLSAVLSSVAIAECIATAYRSGSPIPTFVVLATHDLTPHWERYVQMYPDTGRMAYTAGFFEPALNRPGYSGDSVV